MLRRFFAAALSLLCMILPYAAAGEEEAVPELLEPVGVQLDFEPVRRGTMSFLTLYSGEVACESEELYFEVDGKIDEICVLLGQEVKKGDLLMTLDEKNLRKDALSLEKQLSHIRQINAYENEMAEIDIRIAETRMLSLADDAAIRQAKLDIEDMRTALRQKKELQAIDERALEATLEAAQAKLGKNEILSPFDGQIVYLADVQPDDGVQAYATMLCVADKTKPKIVSEYISEVAYKGARSIYAMIGDGRYEVSMIPADMKENVKKSLMGVELTSEFTFQTIDDGVEIGDYAAICFVTRYMEDALYVPVNAIYGDAQSKYVYKIEDGSRARQNVVCGFTDTMRIQILEGLEEGDYVYIKE